MRCIPSKSLDVLLNIDRRAYIIVDIVVSSPVAVMVELIVKVAHIARGSSF